MECAGNWLSNREYVSEFNKKSARLRIPLSGSIDLTHRCNLRCVHCYLGTHSDRVKRADNEMRTHDILSLIDDITEAGCLFFLITGGEPLLRKDFPDIYRYAKGKGLLVTVFTNGTLITDDTIRLFKDLPPHLVEISLYGATAATYERITCVPGSYEQCMSGIRGLLNGKINVGLKTILMTLNSHEFADIENVAKDLGVKFRFDAAISPCTNGDKAPLSLRVAPEEAIEKEMSDEERLRLWRDYFARVRGQSMSDNLYHCGAGVTAFHVDPYGNLQPCLMTAGFKYDISKSGFLPLWNGAIRNIMDRKATVEFACNQCEKGHLCGFCPAFFELEKGSEQIHSEYLCAMGNHRFRRINDIILKGDKSAN